MHSPTPVQSRGNEKARFVANERSVLRTTNDLAAMRFASIDRSGTTRTLIVTCMDERNTLVDEWFSLRPGEATVYCSGGGRIDDATLDAVFGDAFTDVSADVHVYLVAHQCFANVDAGCAAFKNDCTAQELYFMELRQRIVSRYPMAIVHVFAMDTSTGNLVVKYADARQTGEAQHLVEKALQRTTVFQDEGHAGYGVYIGDAYRAWVGERNDYFCISSSDPNMAADAGIALSVMRHHSAVDLATTPIVFLVDYPVYEDTERTAAAARRIDTGLSAIRALDGVRVMEEDGDLVVLTARTDMRTRVGALQG